MNVKAIDGFPDYYVTDDGRVFSEKYGDRREMKPHGASKMGYLCVGLRVSGRPVYRYIHRLVAEAFLPPRLLHQTEIRHIDGDHMNNTATNLAWGTSTENAADRARHGTQVRGERHGSAKLSDSKVTEIKQALVDGESHDALGRRYGVAQGQIGLISSELTWKHVPNPPGWESRRRSTPERHHARKLSDEQIRSIKRRAAAGERKSEIADSMRLSRAHVGLIVDGKLHAHIAA